MPPLPRALGLIAILAGLVAALPRPAAAYDDLADCAAIDDGTKRLACYDELAGRNPGQSKLTPTKGKWVVTKKVSDINGRPMVSVLLPAESQPDDGSSIYGKARLVLSCNDRETTAFIVPQRLLSLSNDGLDVHYSLDAGAEHREIWQLSEDGRKIFQPRPILWIKSLIPAAKLQVQIIIYGTDSLNFTFDVRGVELAIAPLREVCGW
jgi:type VI secretion system protein VasI